MKILLSILFALNSSIALGGNAEAARCEIQVIIVNSQQFKNRSDTDRFCGRFSDFCSVRRFGEGRWEGSFRYRQSFFGDSRRDAWDRYFEFNGRNRFYSGFNHSVQFKGC